MVKITSTHAGANFTYGNNNPVCEATGEFQTENGKLTTVSVEGQISKDEKVYNFRASRDASGNVNIPNAPAEVLAEVAQEVTIVLAEVAKLATEPSNEQE